MQLVTGAYARYDDESQGASYRGEPTSKSPQSSVQRELSFCRTSKRSFHSNSKHTLGISSVPKVAHESMSHASHLSCPPFSTRPFASFNESLVNEFINVRIWFTWPKTTVPCSSSDMHGGWVCVTTTANRKPLGHEQLPTRDRYVSAPSIQHGR